MKSLFRLSSIVLIVPTLLLSGYNAITNNNVDDTEKSHQTETRAVQKNTPEKISQVEVQSISVSIAGPTVIETDQVYTWTAMVSGSVSYKWYRRETPNDSWDYTGYTGSSYQTYFYNPGSSPKLSSIKVEVTNGSDTDSAVKGLIVNP